MSSKMESVKLDLELLKSLQNVQRSPIIGLYRVATWFDPTL